jgi:citronellol/citronellal dehydrogenase
VQALALKCDIRNEEDVKKAVEEGAKHFGGIDICINNASAIFPKGMKHHLFFSFV